MKRSTVLAALLGIVLGFVGGAFFGVHRLWAVLQPSLESEAVADVNFAIEDLVWHRTGNHDRALAFMESRLDGAILALPRGRDVTALPADARRALNVARFYRNRFPAPESSALVAAALAEIPDEPLDPSSCSPAVKFLLSEAGGG